MLAYKRYVTLQKNGQLLLADLPFKAGQQVEVVLIVQDSEEHAHIKELQVLAQHTEALPHAKAISEEDIVAEINAYRIKQCGL